MKCTSPCFPRCKNEATHEILTMPTKMNNYTPRHLGFNCEAHAKFCSSPSPGQGTIDYVVLSLKDATKIKD